MKKIFVDFDGTLVDSSGCWQEAYRLMCKDKNYVFEMNIFVAFSKISFMEWKKIISARYNIDASKEIMEYVMKLYCEKKPNKKVLEYLNSTKGEITLITREDKCLVESWLKFHHISCVKNIVTLGEERQNQSFYDENIILIDDSLKYCKPAREAGAYVIGINDHHTFKRQKEMKEICNEYWEDE